MLNIFFQKLSQGLAIIGGIVLTLLAISMSVSIVAGSIAKLGYSDWLNEASPAFADLIKATGIRTIPGMYEVMQIGMAFVIFSFLPITSLLKGHAVVDVFTNFLPKKFNAFLILLWELVFLIVMAVITWRLYYGLERMMKSNVEFQELGIQMWYGYAVAFGQMILTTTVCLYVTWLQVVKSFTGKETKFEHQGVVE